MKRQFSDISLLNSDWDVILDILRRSREVNPLSMHESEAYLRLLYMLNDNIGNEMFKLKKETSTPEEFKEWLNLSASVEISKLIEGLKE